LRLLGRRRTEPDWQKPDTVAQSLAEFFHMSAAKVAAALQLVEAMAVVH
jgi:hypothetical protein